MIQVSVQSPDPCRRILHIEVPPEDLRDDYDAVVRRYVAAGRIPGFRSGKAPRHLIERNYESSIQEEFRRVALPKWYREALRQEQLKVLEIVSFDNIELNMGTGLSCDVTVDVEPVFELPAYRDLKVPRQATVVEQAAVEAEIEALRMQMASFEPAPEGHAASADDIVQLDYQATVDGQPLSELATGAETLGRGEGVWVEVAGGRLPMFEGELAGLTVGGEREFDYVFAEDTGIEALRGRTAHYRVRAQGIRCRRLPAVDEAFLKRLGIESQEALEEALQERLAHAAELREEARRRDRVVEFLLTNTPIDVPQSLKEQESAAMAQRLVLDGVRQGASKEQLEQARAEILQQAGQQAEQRVRLSVILRRIADEERIDTTDQEMQMRLQRIAAERQTTVEKLLGDSSRPIDLEAMKQDIRCAKTLQWLSEQALPAEA